MGSGVIKIMTPQPASHCSKIIHCDYIKEIIKEFCYVIGLRNGEYQPLVLYLHEGSLITPDKEQARVLEQGEPLWRLQQ